MREKRKKSEVGLFKSIMIEIRDSILFEVIWNIIAFLPRVMFRLWKNFY